MIRKIFQAICNMIDHDGVEHAGYMAFIMILSIFPFFVFILAFANFFNMSELGELFVEIVIQNLPHYSSESLEMGVSAFKTSPPEELLTLAIIGVIWTSSSFVECLRTILNRVYRVYNAPNYILRRLLSIFQFLVISFAILFGMLMLVIIPSKLAEFYSFVTLIDDHLDWIEIVRYGLIFLVLFITVSALYYFLPNAKLSVIEVLPGAFLVIIAWFISGYLLSEYINYYHQFNVIYGSLGSIIITLIFFYIINMIFIVGSEFNYLVFRQ
jgi:membrane protein